MIHSSAASGRGSPFFSDVVPKRSLVVLSSIAAVVAEGELNRLSSSFDMTTSSPLRALCTFGQTRYASILKADPMDRIANMAACSTVASNGTSVKNP